MSDLDLEAYCDGVDRVESAEGISCALYDGINDVAGGVDVFFHIFAVSPLTTSSFQRIVLYV